MYRLTGNTLAKVIAIILFPIFAVFTFCTVLRYGVIIAGDGWIESSLAEAVSTISDILLIGALPAAIICGVITVSLFIFLMFAAGRHKDEPEVRLNWMDHIPCDLYLLGMCLLIGVVIGWADNLLWYQFTASTMGAIPLLAVALLLCLAICMSFAARFKTAGWWKNSIIFRLLVYGKKFCIWLWKACRNMVNDLPLLWKFILGFVTFSLLSIVFFNSSRYDGMWTLLYLLLNLLALLLLCSVAMQMNRLKKGGESLARGDLDFRIKTDKMFPDFRRHGEHLNSISDGMAVAVEERLKSEHFRTELITNVSHDLKTPLTSIINYVDLLQKENIENETAQGYIEVLARQSARLRKLTEDLIEVSKASTGNVTVDAQPTNVTELINQCLAEYAERFAAAQLTPVIIAPDEAPYIMADGRMLWRVADNLLNNICKYSQPGTRVYCDIAQTSTQVRISLKNVSRDLLNISAAELQERFVRGDSSRGSEGSGLGLAIASSLTELQAGRFSLHLDGDLFKAILIFDRIPAPSDNDNKE